MKIDKELFLDQYVRLRKSHPCGGNLWRIVRLGADIGLKCVKCDRRVLLSRRLFSKQLKHIVDDVTRI